MLNLKSLVFISIFIPFTIFANQEKPQIQLATTTERELQVSEYLISEKLDGVRGYWNGTDLLTRSGRKINTPDWFVKGFPAYPLDGELWIARNSFEQVSAIVRKSQATEDEWQSVKFMVFDLPAEKISFEQRYLKAQLNLAGLSPHLKVIEQFQLADRARLEHRLEQVVALNGEGLMLHKKSALYRVGRNDDLIKLKPFYDAEATVIAYHEGKGKFAGMMGSMLVETDEGIRFRLGSGFSLTQRQTPPPVGTRVTYKYFGLTQKGTPRFASFLRIRPP